MIKDFGRSFRIAKVQFSRGSSLKAYGMVQIPGTFPVCEGETPSRLPAGRRRYINPCQKKDRKNSVGTKDGVAC